MLDINAHGMGIALIALVTPTNLFLTVISLCFCSDNESKPIKYHKFASGYMLLDYTYIISVPTSAYHISSNIRPIIKNALVLYTKKVFNIKQGPRPRVYASIPTSVSRPCTDKDVL